MNSSNRYSGKALTAKTVAKMRSEFIKDAGASLQLLFDMFSNVPDVALVVKNAEGRIMYANHYDVDVSGWKSLDDKLGYNSEELYPPDLAAVYANRDREVMATGVPIVERIYGFVANRSDACNCVTIRPVLSADGKRRIGTATVYWRAHKNMSSASWYDPIRKTMAWINNHYSENPSVETLAEIAHYSPSHFRRLFERMTEMSPSDYMTNVRINVAKTLLRKTDRRISDIAAEIGFFDHAHFIRTFKRLCGLTPAKYRAAHRASARGRACSARIS